VKGEPNVTDRYVPAPADFGGQCLVGECAFDAALLMPSTTCFGLPKSGSYLYGTWRDAEGNLLRALRGVGADRSDVAFLFVSDAGGRSGSTRVRPRRSGAVRW
jgi:hypothetical protein